MFRPRLWILVLLIANAGVVFAADAWVLRGFAGPCLGLQWEADTLLLNTLHVPAVVRLVSISDDPDPLPEPERELVLNPGQTLSLNRNTAWHPGTDVPLFVLRLDVPDGVLIEGALNLGTGKGEDCPLPPAPDSSAAYGVIHLPHFRALVPANQEQIHLGTTLGGSPARNNVGIHNAAALPATAHVSLRRACDNRLVDETTIQLAANSTTQVRLENKSTDTCTGAVPTWVDSVTVTVDQPSVTWVSTLANGIPPRMLISIR
jgi:hypothetical protein